MHSTVRIQDNFCRIMCCNRLLSVAYESSLPQYCFQSTGGGWEDTRAGRTENENDDLSCETWRSKEQNLVVGLRLCASRGRILWFVGSRLPIMVRGRLCPVSWSFYPLCSLPREYWRSGMAPVLSLTRPSSGIYMMFKCACVWECSGSRVMRV